MTWAPHSLDELVPDARGPVERLLRAATDLGLQPRLTSVGRSCQEQADIFAQGSGATHANLCRSWHVLGRAVDLHLEPDAYASYETLGRLWEEMGGIWGGRWTSQFGAEGDRFHFEWADTAAVPTEICPTTVDVDECEAIRAAYYETQHQKSRGSKLAAAAIMATGLAVFAYGWWRLRG